METNLTLLVRTLPIALHRFLRARRLASLETTCTFASRADAGAICDNLLRL